ncbi:hypothetical protein D3Z50_04775 [Clostridiaceae bacterium]|nr:hypothetical protein [Clostridiaceae bacterium]
MKIKIDGENVITNSVIGKDNIITFQSGIDWENLQKEWLNLLQKLPTDTTEYKISSEALQCILNKNKTGLFKTLKSNALSFTSSLFSNVASPFLVDFIKNFI